MKRKPKKRIIEIILVIGESIVIVLAGVTIIGAFLGILSFLVEKST